MRCKFVNKPEPKALSFEVYSFATITADIFELPKAELVCQLKEIWPTRNELFHRYHYEDIIMGMVIYMCNEREWEPMDIPDFIRGLFKENKDIHVARAYSAALIITEIFRPIQMTHSEGYLGHHTRQTLCT